MRRLAGGILAIAITAGPSSAGWADDRPGDSNAPAPVEPAPVDPAPAPADDDPGGPSPSPSPASNDEGTAPPTSPTTLAATPPDNPVPPPPPQEPTADGTTSVVVPNSPETTPAPVAEPVPVVPTQPAGQPPFTPAVASPPPPTQPPPQPPIAPADLPQPPPQSEAALVLAEMLEPIGSMPGRPGPAFDASIYARPLQLLEPLARSGDRSRRLWIVQAYWKVSAAYATLRNASHALDRLELVAPGADPHDRATLDVAIAAAAADLAEARARLGSAQQELIDLARLPLAEPLPWPVDRPLADPYQTHFEAIFANRIATGRVRAIVRGLPARHEALAARAAAVVAAEKAMAMAETDHAKGNRPIEAVIAAHLAVVGQQDRFLEAAKTYNLEIAEYAMAVAELSLPDDQFVSMLIGTPIQWRPPPAVAPATAVAPPDAAAVPSVLAPVGPPAFTTPAP